MSEYAAAPPLPPRSGEGEGRERAARPLALASMFFQCSRCGYGNCSNPQACRNGRPGARPAAAAHRCRGSAMECVARSSAGRMEMEAPGSVGTLFLGLPLCRGRTGCGSGWRPTCRSARLRLAPYGVPRAIGASRSAFLEHGREDQSGWCLPDDTHSLRRRDDGGTTRDRLSGFNAASPSPCPLPLRFAGGEA